MNYKIVYSYDGTNYSGLQKQKNSHTIENEILKSIYKITNENVELVTSGRTDRGVHALCQVSNFKSQYKFQNAEKINELLPKDIYIKTLEVVDDRFHSRYNCKGKTYLYKILKHYNPIERKYCYYYNNLLDIDKMKNAAGIFIGEHDFKAFSSTKKTNKSTVRKVNNLSIREDENHIYFEISGNGFLYNMVRIIVGTLIEVGEGKINADDIYKIFEDANRENAGRTLPPHGLHLIAVEY
ncbi:MAG: tRNA pseudouridine(38-40) synthase TruA [Lachnospirales bacterium]